MDYEWLSAIRRMEELTEHGDLVWEYYKEIGPRTWGTMVGKYVVVLANPCYHKYMVMEVVDKKSIKDGEKREGVRSYFELHRRDKEYRTLKDLFDTIVSINQEEIDVRDFKEKLEEMESDN